MWGIIFIKDILKTVRQKEKLAMNVEERDIYSMRVNQKQIKGAQIENLKRTFFKAFKL